MVSLDLPECTVLRVERVSAKLGLCASPVGSDSLGTTAGRGFCTGDMTRCEPWGLLGGCKVMPNSWLWALFSSCTPKFKRWVTSALLASSATLPRQ